MPIRWNRRLTGSRDTKGGQIAVVFIVLMVVVLVLASMTMNLGQVARQKTGVSNAADAGALAGASWVASGTNEVALISRGMSINVWITQLLYVIPFCWEECPRVAAFFAALAIANSYLAEAAEDVLHGSWDNAHAAALFTAIQNAPIDATGDDANTIQERIQEIQDQFEEDQTVPNPVDFRWMKRGADGVEREKHLRIDVDFLDPDPEFETGGYSVTGYCLSFCFSDYLPVVVDTCSHRPCEIPKSSTGVCFCIAIRVQIAFVEVCIGPIFWPCLPGVGFVDAKEPEENADSAQTSQPTASTGGQPQAPQAGLLDYALDAFGKAWSSSVGAVAPPNILNPDSYGVCEDNWCIPIFIPFGLIPVCPEGIDDRNGQVRVTVTLEQDAEGSRLPFWRMRAPAQLISQATARYRGAQPAGCWGWSQPDGFAEMTNVN